MKRATALLAVLVMVFGLSSTLHAQSQCWWYGPGNMQGPTLSVSEGGISTDQNADGCVLVIPRLGATAYITFISAAETSGGINYHGGGNLSEAKITPYIGTVHTFTLSMYDNHSGVNTWGFTFPQPGYWRATYWLKVYYGLGSDPPSIESEPVLFGTGNLEYQYDVDATDSDGGSVWYSLDVFPPGMTIDANTGLITWTPNNSTMIGDNDVTVRVTDNTELYDTQSFDVTVLKGESKSSAANNDSSGSSDDPVNTYTGELFKQYPLDINLGGPIPLYIARYYASGLLNNNITGSMGNNWRHNFEWTLTDGGTEISIINHKGRLIQFSQNGSVWELTGKTDIVYQLVEDAGEFTLLDPRSRLMYTFNSSGLLTEIYDSNGNIHTLTYDAGKLIDVSDGLGRTLTFAYDSGKLSTVTDGMRAVTFDYTGEDLTQVTDVLGNITTYAYETGGLMTSATLPEGNTPYTQTWRGELVGSQTDSDDNTTAFAYTATDTTITDALGNSQVHSHTVTGELDGSQDSTGESVSIGSDTTGRRNSVTDRLGDTSSFDHHEDSGKLALKTNADGTSSSFSYTERTFGNVTHYDLTGITHADGTTESFEYDANGNLTSRSDRAGNVSSATDNGNGQPLTTTNTAGGVTTHTYNADATLETWTDPTGNTTTFGYDVLRRLSQLTFADASTRQFTYDAENRLLTSTDENGNTTTYSYDDNGNLELITDPLNTTTTFAHDGNDRLISVTDHLGGVVSITYDALGRAETVTDENNHTTTNSYDTLGRLTTVTFPNGNSKSVTYDAEGVIASATDGRGDTTTFTTNPMGRVTRTTSPRGNVSQIEYDTMGRIISTTDPLIQNTTYSFDSRGLLSSIKLLGGGISATLTRDNLGNITQVTDSNGSNWQSSFNNQGLRTSRTDPLNNVQTVAYDNRNRPVTLTYADGVIQTLGYDPAGNLTSRSYSGGGPVFNYSYDANNRLVSANDGPATPDNLTQSYDAVGRISSSNGIAISRDAGGRIIGMTLAEGKSITYAYDANDNLISVTDWADAANNTTTFAYDDNDHPISITRPAANGVDTSYTYDNDGRLAGITEGTISSISLTRDANGQVASAVRNVPLTASAASLSRVVHRFDAASQISTSGFDYDVRGRLLDDDSKTYTWDAASRLSSVAEGPTTTTYTYDALGQRLSRSSDGTDRSFVWNTALNLNSISIERDGAGNDLRYFIHTPAGALLYSIDAVSNMRQFYHYNEMGHTLAVTDDSGAVVGSYAYSPYGRLLASTGALDDPFTWLGQYGVMDEGNGLFYMRARYYDCYTRRFISRDLIESTNPMSLNPYQYASGNPVKFSDPLGLEDVNLDNGWQSIIDVSKEFVEGEAGGKYKLDFFVKALAGEKTFSDFVQEGGKKILEIISKKASTAVKLGELGGKLAIINYNAYQDLEMDRSKQKVQLFMFERALKAKTEARQFLIYDRDVTNLSSMSPLAREILRQMAKERLAKVNAELAAKREIAGELKMWDVGPEIERLEKKKLFLKDVIGPSSDRESAIKY